MAEVLGSPGACGSPGLRSTGVPQPRPPQAERLDCTMFSRRGFLRNAGGGFGMIALAALLEEQGRLSANEPATANPLAPRSTHHDAKAKSVIFLFMSGGPSHLELFAPKPD